MPETIEAPAAPAASGGIDSMIAAKFTPPTPAPSAAPTPEPPKPAETPAAPAAPAATPTAAAPVPKSGFDTLEQDWTPELEKKLRRLYPEHKMWKVKDIVEGKYKASESQLNSELTKLRARPETPANNASIEQLEKLAAEAREDAKTWKQRVEEEAFTRGETYQREFSEPYRRELARGKAEVAGTETSLGMTITENNSGEEVTRPATAKDFQKLLKMDPDEWDAEADKFGRGKQRVIARLLRISDIRERANQAEEDYATNYEKNKVERELAAKRQEQEYEAYSNEAFKGLSADPDLGRYVSESETDPEGTALFKSELEKFDSFKTEMAKMTPKDRAAAVAMVRARFATNPRLIKERKADAAKIASLEADLAKLRGADPGQQIKTVTGGTAPTEAKGVDGLIAGLKWGAQ